MVKIDIIASSSKGNCYYITDGETPLLIECGVPIKHIKQALNYNLSDIRACLVSHEHQDHCRALKDIMDAGIDCYMSEGTIDELGYEAEYWHRLCVMEERRQSTIGTWAIFPFDTVHDCEEPFGFLMQSGTNKVLFMTDTAYCRYKFTGLTHVMIECNYVPEILRENVKKGVISVQQKIRLIQTHFGLNNVLNFFKSFPKEDLEKLKQVYLIHLSDTNSDADLIKTEVQKIVGCEVYV